MLDPAMAKMINSIDAYIAAYFAVRIRSFFDDFAVITENNANVDEGLTIMNKGMNTAKNVEMKSGAIEGLFLDSYINVLAEIIEE